MYNIPENLRRKRELASDMILIAPNDIGHEVMLMSNDITKRVGDRVLMRDLEPGEAFRAVYYCDTHRYMLHSHVSKTRAVVSRYSDGVKQEFDSDQPVLRAQPDTKENRLAE